MGHTAEVRPLLHLTIFSILPFSQVEKIFLEIPLYWSMCRGKSLRPLARAAAQFHPCQSTVTFGCSWLPVRRHSRELIKPSVMTRIIWWWSCGFWTSRLQSQCPQKVSTCGLQVQLITLHMLLKIFSLSCPSPPCCQYSVFLLVCLFVWLSSCLCYLISVPAVRWCLLYPFFKGVAAKAIADTKFDHN